MNSRNAPTNRGQRNPCLCGGWSARRLSQRHIDMLRAISDLQEQSDVLEAPTVEAVGRRLRDLYATWGAIFAWNLSAPWYGTYPVAGELEKAGLIRSISDDRVPQPQPCDELQRRLALTAGGLCLVVDLLVQHASSAERSPHPRQWAQRAAELRWVPLP
jgi:hypothetical protein